MSSSISSDSESNEMGRYIRNPYVGKEATSSEEVTEKWLEQAVKIIADQIINREFDDEELQDVGPYTGLSGVAFALNKAAPIVGSKATSTAEKCWQYCERSSSRQARFLCGDLGVYVTQMSNPELRQSLVEKIEKLSVTLAKDDYPSDEMLVGRAGFLSGVLWIRTTIDHTLISNDCVQKVLSAMILSGRSFYDLLSDTEERAVRESADWLMSTQDDEGNFASSVKWIGRERGDDQLVHWCHGAPGYALLMLYRACGDEEWLHRARCFALMLLDRNIRAAQRIPDSPFSLFEADLPCVQKVYKSTDHNIVCVCNGTYCDDIEPVTKIARGKAVVYVSSLAGKRFQKSTIPVSGDTKTATVEVSVDARQEFQSIIGFGGAFTDSVGINLNSLKESTRQKLLEAYFGKNGIGYNLGRVPIASTDFSTREYSYADVEGDMKMTGFSLTDEDFDYKIPYILTAMNLTGGKIRLFASPWSAPGWMKTNGRMKGGGTLKGKVNGPYYQSYATYLVRFFEEYAKNGIPFWGMTLQNEPTSGALPFYGWQTMLLTATMERDFVKGILGPLFKSNSATKNLKVIALDDNRLSLPRWADIIFNDPEATKYVDGIGVHWYLNFLMPAKVFTTTHNRHPDKFLLATEACAGSTLIHGPVMGDWYRAEEYAEDIITDLNNFVAGWTDWNICLDEQGGPNWVSNFVDSPIIVNASADEFYKQPMFYAMGHFSKFIKMDAVGIATKVEGKQGLIATAVDYEGRRTLVLLNQRDSSEEVQINDLATGHHLYLTLERRSIATVLWDKQ
ncbi:O-Glycosyl hydrolase family 30 [Ancylostoma ceylanicum]|uniref:Glucosylceramidase n=1 Tax=Ancylostoma ceylanicum TaxID=53326 RepID=A0A0D6MC62_9BILA|nr:O-Glycosyl hydrolase family 30 [Ancylostoma ceylanicum]